MTSRTVWTANSDGTLTPELMVVNPESHCRTPKVAINSSCSALFGTGLECRVSSVECRVSSAECRVPSAECRVSSNKAEKAPLQFFFYIMADLHTQKIRKKQVALSRAYLCSHYPSICPFVFILPWFFSSTCPEGTNK